MIGEKEKLIERILNTTKPVRVRFGFGWKGAEWSRATKEQLISTLNAGKYAHYDIFDEQDFFGLNFYSANDML